MSRYESRRLQIGQRADGSILAFGRQLFADVPGRCKRRGATRGRPPRLLRTCKHRDPAESAAGRLRPSWRRGRHAKDRGKTGRSFDCCFAACSCSGACHPHRHPRRRACSELRYAVAARLACGTSPAFADLSPLQVPALSRSHSGRVFLGLRGETPEGSFFEPHIDWESLVLISWIACSANCPARVGARGLPQS